MKGIGLAGIVRIYRPTRINRSTDQPINGSTSALPCGSADQRINRSTSSGITLIELLVVVAIIGLMTAISFPTLTTGLDGFRLRAAVDRAANLFQQARQEADRRQRPVQLTADPRANELRALAVDSSWRETLALEDGIRIVVPAAEQHWVLYPGTPPPQVRLLLEAQTGSRRGFSINVFTGVADDWTGPAGQ